MGNSNRMLDFGVTTPGGPCATDELDAVSDLLGRNPQYVLWYEDFASPPPLDELAAADRIGAVPVITWEPWTTSDRGNDTWQSLCTGAFDEYIHEWVAELQNWQRPICLRFAHEFNGDWYPWTPDGGTPPDAHAASWRRIHGMFTAGGATNVRWMWCPDAGLSRDTTLKTWYPGDEFVDIIGVDGFNWGTSRTATRWRSPAEIFDAVLAQAEDIADGRPVVIAEVACAEEGGSKADWITAFVRYLRECTTVSGFVWFDHDKETDWRITSTPRAAAALVGALRGPA
ncbi:glycoside hydrolase family 26 protein [Mycobacterium sp. NPDC003323]